MNEFIVEISMFYFKTQQNKHSKFRTKIKMHPYTFVKLSYIKNV